MEASRPESSSKFFQPSCKTGTAPCDPKTAVYQSKRYLVLGEERRSTYSDSKFQLDVRYDYDLVNTLCLTQCDPPLKNPGYVPD